MKTLLKDFVSIANKCDEAGLHSEAEVLDELFKKLAQSQEEHVDSAGLRWVSEGPMENNQRLINWKSDKGHRYAVAVGEMPSSAPAPKRAPAPEPGYFDSLFSTSEKPEADKPAPPAERKPIIDLEEQGSNWQKLKEVFTG